MIKNSYGAKRIVCLTEETTEALYLMGEQDRIVGISGFTVRPTIARKEKPKVSAFTSAKIDKILALKPDLVLAFSDMQADITAELVRAGLQVHVFNQRSVNEIFDMLQTLGALIGEPEKAALLVEQYQQNIDACLEQAKDYKTKPVIYFEEWDNPLISGIRWVAELGEIAGGIDAFPDLSKEAGGKNRIIADPQEVIKRQPDIIIGSWCGKKFRPERVAEREGWGDIPAVKNKQIFEIKSVEILQPGPAALTDGLQRLEKIIGDWVAQYV
ncbi:MAG: cobalamin-binding protein [Cycloclasticus sp. symbiont of Poecilosclerida sp. M]|nr:MAG: cobalamin-binding protein [Cycloclasticus sp. symbiont of Poecilosclerida sp. M]